jgi:hypothetical protein
MSSDKQPAGRIVIAGGSGFLGLNLARHLADGGCEVVLSSRRAAVVDNSRWRHLVWDGHSLGDWAGCLDGAAGLVNLAGRTVDCIKTPDHCDEILRSRVEATRVLGLAVRQVGQPPSVWVQMATAHRYGDPPERVCDEDAAFDYGMAPFVGQAWEEAFAAAVLPEMRQVILRTSFVIGRSGGAIPRLARLVRWGLGGKVGHGRQGMSWIHEHDMNRLFAQAIADETMAGAYIATAPNPVSNAIIQRTRSIQSDCLLRVEAHLKLCEVEQVNVGVVIEVDAFAAKPQAIAGAGEAGIKFDKIVQVHIAVVVTVAWKGDQGRPGPEAAGQREVPSGHGTRVGLTDGAGNGELPAARHSAAAVDREPSYVECRRAGGGSQVRERQRHQEYQHQGSHSPRPSAIFPAYSIISAEQYCLLHGSIIPSFHPSIYG